MFTFVQVLQKNIPVYAIPVYAIPVYAIRYYMSRLLPLYVL